MTDRVEFKIENSRDLVRELRAFSEDVAIKTVRQSVRRIGDYLTVRLRSSAPVFTGKLRFNFRVLTRYVRRRGVVSSRVVVNTVGKSDNAKNAFYWRFVEFGHKTRPSKKGKGTGPQRQIPGQLFATQTMLNTQSQVSAMFYRDLQAAIERAQRRNRKR